MVEGKKEVSGELFIPGKDDLEEGERIRARGPSSRP